MYWWRYCSGSVTLIQCWTHWSMPTSIATFGKRSKTHSNAYFSIAGTKRHRTVHTTYNRIDLKSRLLFHISIQIDWYNGKMSKHDVNLNRRWSELLSSLFSLYCLCLRPMIISVNDKLHVDNQLLLLINRRWKKTTDPIAARNILQVNHTFCTVQTMVNTEHWTHETEHCRDSIWITIVDTNM